MRTPQLSFLVISAACAVTSLGCNAERVEIPDPPAESVAPKPGPKPSDVEAPSAPPPAASTSAPAPPAAPRVRTVGTLGGLLDFDFDETTLVLLGKSGAHTCALAGCSAPQRLSGLSLAAGNFALAGGRLYFDDARAPHDHDLASARLDGADVRTEASYGPFTASATFFSFHGGDSVYGLLRRTPVLDAGRFEHVFLSPPRPAENHARIGRVTANVHTNGGARVEAIPSERPGLVTTQPWTFRVAGASVPRPASEPLAIGTSPLGAGHPTVVVRRGEHLEACPVVDGVCGAWIDLGDVRGTFALDGASLYVGGETGLFACGLDTIAATGACTFTKITEEPVTAPLYVTQDELIFMHGSDVRAAKKLLDE